jgi:hypothetical protein
MLNAKNTSVVAIKLPFKLLPNGLVETSSNYNQIWADRVRSVLLTSKYERVNRFDFGTNLYDGLMGNSSGIGSAEETVVRMVQESFSSQLIGLSLEDVSVNFDISQGLLDVTVTYKLPNKDVATTRVNSLSILGSNPPSIKAGPYFEGDM